MAGVIKYTPYVTARQLMTAQDLPGWLDEDDGERVGSYTLYERMYWNAPAIFKLTARGTEDNPIYMPSARGIIETCGRFLAKRWTFAIDPTMGAPADRESVRLLTQKLFAREQLYTKFATQKRFGLIRGDSVWHILADPAKPQGSRISVLEVHPGNYFPITDPNDNMKVIGVHLAEPGVFEGKDAIKRQTYRKDLATGTITTELGWYETTKWDDRTNPDNIAQLGVVVPPTPLPPAITTLPVYHITNNRSTELFGASELRGLERVIAGINQGISDEDLALALAGLGVYSTTSGPPTDDDGNESDWVLGPGRVVEIDPDSVFDRVKGIDSVTPYQDHLKYLADSVNEAIGHPAVARGTVDVAIAESGIALALELSPLLAKNEEKEVEMLSVYDHMFYDLVYQWYPAYEQLSVQGVSMVSVVGDPIPQNRKEQVDEILKLLAAGVISAAYAQQQLTAIGYDFPADMQNTILEETIAKFTAMSSDIFAERLRAENDPANIGTGGTGA